MDSVTIRLTKPVKDFGKVIEEVTISREVVGSDMVACDGLGANAATLKLIERLCGISEAATMSLMVKDVKTIEAAMAPFAGYGPENSTPSTVS